MALDATISGTSANSYIDLTTANAYFATRHDSALWSTLTNAEKETLLITATNRLEAELFAGYKAVDGQALEWPRRGLYNWDNKTISTTAMSKQLVAATCELAYQFLKGETTIDKNVVSKTETLGNLSQSVTYTPGVASDTDLNDTVKIMLRKIGDRVWFDREQSVTRLSL